MKRISTYFAKPHETQDEWQVIDATGKTLGRMARDIAMALQGKDKPTYTPHVITGSHVIVTNAAKVRVTGRKLLQKTYYRHTGWTGHLRSTTAGKLLSGPHADRVVSHAVRGMLPKNSLGRQMFRKLKVYAGAEHPHAAQRPEVLQLG